MSSSSHTSLSFVSATSPEGLVAECLKNNISKGYIFGYFSVTIHNGIFYAWYLEKMDLLISSPPKVKRVKK